MSESISLSQEQADMIAAGAQPALELLMASGLFQPTLYLHDGEKMTFYNLVVSGVDELLAMARQMVKNTPAIVAYALFYDSSVDTEEGPMDALFIETGDADDDEAHEFFRAYNRQTGFLTTRIARLGPAVNFLK